MNIKNKLQCDLLERKNCFSTKLHLFLSREKNNCEDGVVILFKYEPVGKNQIMPFPNKSSLPAAPKQ
jgi:hypothetical protein